jgi:hypothetical protein
MLTSICVCCILLINLTLIHAHAYSHALLHTHTDTPGPGAYNMARNIEEEIANKGGVATNFSDRRSRFRCVVYSVVGCDEVHCSVLCSV